MCEPVNSRTAAKLTWSVMSAVVSEPIRQISAAAGINVASTQIPFRTFSECMNKAIHADNTGIDNSWRAVDPRALRKSKACSHKMTPSLAGRVVGLMSPLRVWHQSFHRFVEDESFPRKHHVVYCTSQNSDIHLCSSHCCARQVLYFGLCCDFGIIIKLIFHKNLRRFGKFFQVKEILNSYLHSYIYCYDFFPDPVFFHNPIWWNSKNCIHSKLSKVTWKVVFQKSRRILLNIKLVICLLIQCWKDSVSKAHYVHR